MEMTINDKLFFNEKFLQKDLYSPMFRSTNSQSKDRIGSCSPRASIEGC